MNDQWNVLRAVCTLSESVAQQRDEIGDLITKLAAASQRYDKAVEALPQQVDAGVDRALGNAAQEAASLISARLTEANAHADAATIAYARAAKVAPWLIFGSVAITMLFMLWIGVSIARHLLPSADRIAALRIEEQTLRANVNELEKRGGRTPLAVCNDLRGQPHMCVRVDDRHKTDLPGYRIIVY
jgi:hypothetical protein